MAYGALGLPLAFLALPLYVTLPHHYATRHGLPLALLGAVLLGTRLLGTAARECTATVTRLRWGEPYDYVATFENGEVQRFSEKLPDPAAGYAEAIAALTRAREALSAAGWRVETIWECDLKDAAVLEARLRGLLSSNPPRG